MEHDDDFPNDQEVGSTHVPMRQDFAMSELEKLSEGPKPGVNPGELKLDGDNVPEQFRGKSLADVLGTISGLQNALRTSEEGRQQALATMTSLTRGESRAPAPAPAPVDDYREPTKDELKKLFEEDQFAYHQKMDEIRERRVLRAIDERVSPLTASSVDSAERTARQTFAEDFTILGKEIEEFVSSAFPDRRILAQPGAWDRVVKYVRGEHVDKIIAHREAQKTRTTNNERRRAEDDAAPPTMSARQPAPRTNGKLTPATMDDTQKEIARNLGVSAADYCKYYV